MKKKKEKDYVKLAIEDARKASTKLIFEEWAKAKDRDQIIFDNLTSAEHPEVHTNDGKTLTYGDIRAMQDAMKDSSLNGDMFKPIEIQTFTLEEVENIIKKI